MFSRWAKNNVRTLQAIAATCAIIVAIYNIFGKAYFERLFFPPDMIAANEFVVTKNRIALTDFISAGGGAWSRDVDLSGYTSDLFWRRGERGVLAVQFDRKHEQCATRLITARLIDQFNIATQLVHTDISTVFAPVGQNILVSAMVIPLDLSAGHYELYATLTYACKTPPEIVVGFPQIQIEVK